MYFNPNPKEGVIRLKGNAKIKFRNSIFGRDNFRCRNPDCTDPWAEGPLNALDPHHKPKRSQGGSDIPEHVFTVCRVCHGKIERHELKEDFLDG